MHVMSGYGQDGMDYGEPSQQAAFAAPPPAEIMAPGPSGNLWLNELRNQVSAADAARMEQWARRVGLQLNWGLPLRPHVFILEARDLVKEDADGNRNFNMRVQFGFPVYIKQFTFAAPQMTLSDFGNTAVLPDPVYFAQNASIKPSDFVEFRLRRSNNEVFTSGQDTSYATASSWMGTGEAPYNALLYLFYQQGESFVLEGRLARCVENVEQLKVHLHLLQVPVGTQVSP